jgi:zinc transport system substrate-binding protein
MRIVLIAGLVLSLSACGTASGSGDSSDDGVIEVVASFWPLEWAAEAFRAEGVEVADLTPPGVEPHDLELSTEQVDRLEDADLVIVLGGGFQPAVEEVAERRDGPTLTVLDELGLDVDDPHVWLDPTVMARVLEVSAAALLQVGAPVANAEDFGLDQLDHRYQDTLANCRSSVLVTEHAAFGALARRYELEAVAVAGTTPEGEPDPRRLDEVSDLVRDREVATVFTESDPPSEVIETLADETGASILRLHSLETLTDAERNAGADYLSLMEDNLAALADGLGCG